MSRSGPAAAVVRRCGLSVVVVACVAATVVNHDSFSLILIDWLALPLYLFCCAEPLRRVLRNARTTRTITTVYVLTAGACVTAMFALPVTRYAGTHTAHVAVFGRFGGDRSLSDPAQQRYLALAWSAFAVLVVATLALWALVARLARASEWRAIDHTVGDGAMLTGATLQEPAGGTSITRPAQSRRNTRR